MKIIKLNSIKILKIFLKIIICNILIDIFIYFYYYNNIKGYFSDSMKKIGKRLQELRESKGLSQSDLANYLGISQPLLSQIESGNRNLNLSLIDKLCSLYGCSDSYILCKSDEYNSINFSFRSKNAAKQDLDCIASVHKIIMNMRFLNKLNEDDLDER